MTDKKSSELNLQDVSSDPYSTGEITHGAVIDVEHYQATVPLWRRVWQHSLTQMMLLSIQAFCGPAMADAITGKRNNPSLILENQWACVANSSKVSVVVVLPLRGYRISRMQSHMP